MGVSLTKPSEGNVAWSSTVDTIWTTLESQFVARQASDTSAVTVSGTTAETVLMSNTTLPANALAAGTVLAVFAAGSITVPASTVVTPTFRLRWGGISGPVLLSWTPFTYTTGGAAGTASWNFDGRVVCVSAGASGSAETNAWGSSSVSGTSKAGVAVAYQSGTTTIDTTTSKTLVWTVQSSVAAVSTTQYAMLTNRG